MHRHPGAQPVAIGAAAGELDRQGPDLTPLRQVADQNLGAVVELAGDDVEVAVAVEVEDHRGPRAHRTGHRHLASAAGELAERVAGVGATAVDGEDRRMRAAAGPRLAAENELGAAEGLSRSLSGTLLTP
ncbi:MAG TPA: hypothetical protein VMV46_00405 [Thermoanaerobaculia bacterium]|nr:hypothetical protein [Thermoanaerobaculia bacterium]